ncbi:MAG: hypothetical protein RR324_00540 [Cellulosilyticaceae bacterium]
MTLGIYCVESCWSINLIGLGLIDWLHASYKEDSHSMKAYLPYQGGV